MIMVASSGNKLSRVQSMSPIARPIVNEGFSILALSDVLVVLGSWRIDDLILSHASEHGLSLQLNRDRNAKG